MLGVLAALAAAQMAPTAVAAPARQTLRGHVPAAVTRLQPIGRLSGSTNLNLAIGLPLRKQDVLQKLLHDLYDPASPQYHQYLTPTQFTDQFGPTEQDYQALMTFAQTNGLTVTALHPNRMLLDVQGAVTNIERVFHVTMRVYQHPEEARTFHAPDVEPSLDLAVPILHVSGLDDFALPHPMHRHQPIVGASAQVTPNAGTWYGTLYWGTDFRTAYVPGTTLTGAGQSVGLLQFDGYTASDITYYENNAGLPNIPLQNVLLDGATGASSGNGGEVEVSLDIEMVASMAPGLSKIIVYMAPNNTGYWDDLLNQMTDDNLAKQFSCSWSGGSHNATHDQIFQQMAALGQSFFCASGDSGAFSGAIPFPSDCTNIVQVGGTKLTTGAGATYASETVWSPGGTLGSSGGISTYYSIPGYQQGISTTTNQGSPTMRNVPDVAMIATQVYVRADSGDYNVSGTSCAAPLWAGFCALVNQQAAAGNRPPVGFLDPALYALGKGSGYAAAFHDITVGNNTNSASPSAFFAEPGYDLCTGWGTPNGTNLINALAPFDPSVPHLALTGAQVNDSNAGNGNGFPDPGETIRETIVWTNSGGATATNITATLVTAAAGVSLLQSTSAYPDIPVLSSASNATPFSYRLSKSVPAGTVLVFTNLVNTGGQVFTGTFSRTVGEPPVAIATAVTNTSGVAIPVRGTVYVTNLVAAAANVIGLVTASVRLNFSRDSSLVIALQHPDGTEVILANKEGNSGQNYGTGYPSAGATVSTIFDDRAATAISAGSAPFAGTYQPDGKLTNFVGKSAGGAWRLRLADSSSSYSGTFYCWGLAIELAPTQYTAVVFDHPPVASNQNVHVSYAGVTNLTLRGSDPDGDTLTFGITTFPGHGTLTNFNTNSGAITYIAAAKFWGTDTFAFVTNDGWTNSPPATVAVTVYAPPSRSTLIIYR